MSTCSSPGVTLPHLLVLVFFFNDPATTEIYTLSLHDALPIFRSRGNQARDQRGCGDPSICRSGECAPRGRGPHHHGPSPSRTRRSPTCFCRRQSQPTRMRVSLQVSLWGGHCIQSRGGSHGEEACPPRSVATAAVVYEDCRDRDDC